jgi:branched-chain amino acid transport system permease protein
VYGSRPTQAKVHDAGRAPEYGGRRGFPTRRLGATKSARPVAPLPVIGVTAGLLIAVIVIPGQSGFAIYAATLASVYAIAGLGGSVLLGHGGLVSLGQGGTVAVSAYLCGQLINHGVPFGAVLIIGGMIGFTLGGVIGIPSLRIGGHTLAVTTLFFALAVPELITAWTSLTGGASGLTISLGATPVEVFYLAATALTVIMLFQYFALNSRIGSGLRLVRDSPWAAASTGRSVARFRIGSFMYAGFTAGVAGAVLTGATGYLSPDVFTIWLSVYILVGSVMFGFTNPASAVLGGLFVGEVPQQVSQYQGLSGIIFGTVVLVLVVAPRWPVSQRALREASRRTTELLGRQRGLRGASGGSDDA